jgi:signal transduction histidine kinase
VTVRVADNGIGIERAHRNEVFGVFTRLNADDRYPGSGIGLATCAKVVTHHGGRIWLEDGIDGGIAVVVWLPHLAPAP